MNEYRKFYENIDRGKYASGCDLSNDSFYEELSGFVKKYNLEDKHALEIGSGNGKYQDIVDDYTGVDISNSLSKFFHKKYVVLKENEKYPFSDGYFDLVFTNSVFEHIPDIEFALKEMLRVLKNKGYIFFNMAWQARPWMVQGYSVRPYSDFNFKGKIVKSAIPVYNSVLFRMTYIIPRRILRTIKFLLNRGQFINKLDYKKLKANYETYYGSDSDACNSVDPHAMILYFVANNCEVINYPNLFKAFFVRTGNLEIQKL